MVWLKKEELVKSKPQGIESKTLPAHTYEIYRVIAPGRSSQIPA